MIMKGTSFDEYWAAEWDTIDWKAARAKLEELQRKLTIAAFGKNSKKIKYYQDEIVNDLDIRCLAVCHVCKNSTRPGIDKEKWVSSADKMKAALALNSPSYEASPTIKFQFTSKNTGKTRWARLATYRDRAMATLWSYALGPVVEAAGDRKSFAFRQGRSVRDAHEYVLDALKGSDAPEYVVCADVKSYYATIQHEWLIKYLPMNKHILREFLKADIIYDGELFPSASEGIPEGSSLSPIIGNFVLDGLQKHIHMYLHGTNSPEDYSNGNLIRFADDMIVTVRSMEDGKKVLEAIHDFISVRGLALSEEKTQICCASDGFPFLGHTYIKKNNIIYAYPSEKVVDTFISNITTFISTNRKSQRDLILKINEKLKGWAAYHRYTDAEAAFRRVDVAVQAALLDTLMQKHPKWPKEKIISKYWYKEPDGRHCYALPNDKSIRVIRLQDTLLITHDRIRSNINPYVDRETLESRTHIRAVQNVTGSYRAIWDRQNGICQYCGRPILKDQEREIVPVDLRKPPSIRNSVYIHSMCQAGEYHLVQTMEDISIFRPYDVHKILEGISDADCTQKTKHAIDENWKHYKLKTFFAKSTEAFISLSFKEIERIDKHTLPEAARRSRNWWYPRKDWNTIAEAWRTEGYSMYSLDITKEKVVFRRNESGEAKLEIPAALTRGKIPVNAIYELEKHFDYIIEKYALS